MPDIHSILSVSPKEGLDLWALNTGTHLRSVQIPIHSSSTAPVLIDEEHVVVAQCDKSNLLIVNWKTGQVKTRSQLLENVKPICISNDREYLAAGAASGKIYIWQVSTGELVRMFEAHYNGVTSLAFTDDDTFLVSGGDDGILNVWVLGELLEAGIEDATGRLSPFVEFSNHSLPITSVVCGLNSSGGGKIISSSLDRTVKMFSLASKTLISSFNFPSAVTCVTMDSAETFICVSCVDGNIYKVLLLSNSQTDQGSDTSGSAMAAISSRNISSVNLAHASSKWNSSLWEGERDLLIFSGHTKEVTSVSLSFNNTLLLSSSLDGYVLYFLLFFCRFLYVLYYC